MSNGSNRRFTCTAQRLDDCVEIDLHSFKFGVRIRESQNSWVRLANGVVISFGRPDADLGSICVSLQLREAQGQTVRLRNNEPRTVAINWPSGKEARNSCKRQLAAQRLDQNGFGKETFLVHVSDNAEIVKTTEGTADADFKLNVAVCHQGPENAEGMLQVYYVREKASDQDVAAALVGRKRFSIGALPRDLWLLLLNAHVEFDAAEEFAAVVPAAVYEEHTVLHQYSSEPFPDALTSLLAIWGPRLIANRVSGRAKMFLECFTFPETWRASDKRWQERLAAQARNPWKYIKEYYRVRGVTGGTETMLWIAAEDDKEFDEELDFYDSGPDKFSYVYWKDVEFLLRGQTGRSTALASAIAELVAEPLVEVVGWHYAPVTVERDSRRQSQKVTWQGETFYVERNPRRADNWRSEQDFSIFNIDLAGGWREFTVLSEDPFQSNSRYAVRRVLKDGAPAGIVDEHWIVCRHDKPLILIVRNGMGDHMVVSFTPRPDGQVNLMGSSWAPVAAAERPLYRLLFRGSHDGLGYTIQDRRRHVFAQRIEPKAAA